MADTVRKDAVEQLQGRLFDGMTIMAGGFGLYGIRKLMEAIRASGVKHLTVATWRSYLRFWLKRSPLVSSHRRGA